jgi:hypothetical protein
VYIFVHVRFAAVCPDRPAQRRPGFIVRAHCGAITLAPASAAARRRGALLLAALAAASHGADPGAEQIERARVLREMSETSPPARDETRPVLPPARLEIEQQDAAQEQAVTIENDLRWRQLLGDQARERNLPGPTPGAAQIRSQQHGRAQDAQELHFRIQQKDLEYRLQRSR